MSKTSTRRSPRCRALFGCGRSDRADLEQARKDVQEAKATISKLRAELAGTQKPAGDGQSEPPPAGMVRLEKLAEVEKVFGKLHGEEQVVGGVFRYVGRGAPACWVSDEKGKAVLGPAPAEARRNELMGTYRKEEREPDPICEGFVSLTIRGGKARLIVTVETSPRTEGVASYKLRGSAEEEVGAKDKGIAFDFTAGPQGRATLKAGTDIPLLKFDGKTLWFRLHPGKAEGAEKK